MNSNPATPPKQETATSFDRLSAPLMDLDARVPQFNLKKILVPVDFSDCSKKALEYAVPLARRYGASITFLYVVPFNSTLGRAPVLADESGDGDFTESAVRMLTRLAHENVPPKIPVRLETRCGAESAEIVRAASKLEADLIVISTHGRTGRAHSLTGSVAADVVRLAPCPVLVVREREREFVQSQTTTN
jgi:universal stress protein A